jgi:hypothetical protein
MKKIVLFLIFLFSFLSSQEIVIDERKNDIYFANGIMNTKRDAESSLALLYEATKKGIYDGNTETMKRFTSFDLLYNESHGMFLDLLEAFKQKKTEHQLTI